MGWRSQAKRAGNVSLNQKWVETRVFDSTDIFFLIILFLLPKDALNCVVLAPPNFLSGEKGMERRARLIKQYKNQTRNFVNKMNKKTQIFHISSPIEAELYPELTPNVVQGKREIALDFKKLADYFEKLTVKMIFRQYRKDSNLEVYFTEGG